MPFAACSEMARVSSRGLSWEQVDALLAMGWRGEGNARSLKLATNGFGIWVGIGFDQPGCAPRRDYWSAKRPARKRRRPIPCPHVSEGDKRDADRLGRGAPHRRAAHLDGRNDLGGASDRYIAQPIHRSLELATCLAVGPLDGVSTGRGQTEGDEDRCKDTEEQKDAARGDLRHVAKGADLGRYRPSRLRA
jgi:hypothetical protein